ncbi:septation ring formation regulator EzrA [Bacillus sp. FJAT-45037]|uniref:septation ring formation regulator EzrA n=1 Tax=Bacillus sp. FJAT-45037 TaxID=2011007 RepID=UPI001E38E054|nr:septation ring formation regulator EzrA [Bacillus sp. FJAT-45037]
MYVIYTAVVALTVLFILGMVLRKNIYKEVDKLDDWKNTILNRDIPSEIGKVKDLHMSGETEEKFDLWRNEWDDIVGSILPNIEEQLFDIEEYASKYRFKKAKQVIDLTKQRLSGVENQLQAMVEEINQLILSAEQNSTEIGAIRERFQTLQQQLLKRRGTLGTSIDVFDGGVEEARHLLVSFEEATDEGSYLKAREFLGQAKTDIDELHEYLEVVPKLLVQLKTTIPQEIRQLSQGIEDMIKTGYHLEPFSFTTHIGSIQTDCEELLKKVATLEDVESIEEGVSNLIDQIEQMYEVLEVEVEAKQTVVSSIPAMREQIADIDDQLIGLEEETSYVQQSYRLAEEELAFQDRVKKKLMEVMTQLQVIVDVSENEAQTFTSILDLVEEWNEAISALQIDIEKGRQALQDLREDELKAKETLGQLRQKMLESRRTLQKSNIPGLPIEVIQHLGKSEDKLVSAAKQLAQVPLEMGRVNVLVEESLALIHENEQLIEHTVESAQLAERVIQYANRYRNRSEKAKAGMIEAEELFRAFEYDEAIECARYAVHEYDSSLVERVSEQVTV